MNHFVRKSCLSINPNSVNPSSLIFLFSLFLTPFPSSFSLSSCQHISYTSLMLLWTIHPCPGRFIPFLVSQPPLQTTDPIIIYDDRLIRFKFQQFQILILSFFLNRILDRESELESINFKA